MSELVEAKTYGRVNGKFTLLSTKMVTNPATNKATDNKVTEEPLGLPPVLNVEDEEKAETTKEQTNGEAPLDIPTMNFVGDDQMTYTKPTEVQLQPPGIEAPLSIAKMDFSGQGEAAKAKDEEGMAIPSTI